MTPPCERGMGKRLFIILGASILGAVLVASSQEGAAGPPAAKAEKAILLTSAGGRAPGFWNSPMNVASSDHGASFDRSRAMAKASSPAWQVNVGGSGNDRGEGIAVDINRASYIAGASDSTWGSPVRPFASHDDAFAAKLDSGGNVAWNTFLGGSGGDYGYGIAVDGSGNVHVTGSSSASWSSRLDPQSADIDAFYLMLNPWLICVSLHLDILAGVNPDVGKDIAVDESGNAYVTGDANAIMMSPALAYNASPDAFVAKMSETVGLPKIGLSRQTLNFGAMVGGVATKAQSVIVSNTGGGTLAWAASSDKSWLSASPASGTGTAVIQVSVNPAGLSAGTQTGKITVSDPNASNTPQEITVTMTVLAVGMGAVPFGDFATPLDGTTGVTGAIPVTGWVLTPLPKTVPKDGSTIDVYVDSVKLGNLATPPNVYNQRRQDVADAFPGLNNTDGAVGAYFLNTTAYPDGVHTIFWIATDDAGQADGIGSRYCTFMAGVGGEIKNATSLRRGEGSSGPGTEIAGMGKIGDMALDVSSRALRGISFTFATVKDILTLPLSFDPLSIKRGFNLAAPPEPLIPDRSGSIQIEMREVDRIEIDFGKGPAYRGYVLVGDELRPLPIGSTLDRAKGIFSWLAGPGFLGAYEFVFIREDGFGIAERIPIKVTIRPKFKN